MRYLPGIVFSQIVVAALMWLNIDLLTTQTGLLTVIVPSAAVATVTAFWFTTLTRQISDARISKLQQQFATEREKLKTNAERVKSKIIEQTQKEINRQAKRTHAKANFKVGAALTGAVSFGVLMMFTQFATVGLLLLAGAGGALGGYMLRFKRERNLNTIAQSAKAPPRVLDAQRVVATEESR